MEAIIEARDNDCAYGCYLEAKNCMKNECSEFVAVEVEWEYRKVEEPLSYPMIELSNGDIVQFMAYAEEDQELWRVFNDHNKKYLYLREHKIWATKGGDVLLGLTIVKEIK